MPRGGKREGAGRKTKAEEMRLAEILDTIGDSEKVLSTLYKNACNPKNTADRQLWLAYRFGKPKDNEGQPTEMIINVLRNS